MATRIKIPGSGTTVNGSGPVVSTSTGIGSHGSSGLGMVASVESKLSSPRPGARAVTRNQEDFP